MTAVDRPFDPARDYPVAERRPDLVRAQSGRPLAEITLDAVLAGDVKMDDLRITPEALERQAAVAVASGRPALSSNFERASELIAVPDARILEIYEALRPRRSTLAQLEAIAIELEQIFNAHRTAALVREAADAYVARGLLAPA